MEEKDGQQMNAVMTDDARARALAIAREDLRRRYGLKSEVLRVSDLSRILGMNPNTIRTAMKGGRLSIPFERVCCVPVFKLDDVAHWLCGAICQPIAPQAIEPNNETVQVGYESVAGGMLDEGSKHRRAKSVVDGVIREMERRSKKVPR